MSRVILVAGPPRTGTSLVAGAIAAHGAWAECGRKTDKNNRNGYIDSRTAWRVLRQWKLNGPWPIEELRTDLFTAADHTGWDGLAPWVFKIHCIDLPILLEVFPEAPLVLCQRSYTTAVTSAASIRFAGQDTMYEEFTQLDKVKNSEEHVLVDFDQVIAGDIKQLGNAVMTAGFEPSYEFLDEFVDPRMKRF